MKITFWHSMTGSGSAAADKMAADFNASQEEYVVEPSFQGQYSESLKKLVSSFGTNEMPSIIQMHDVGTQFMADSGVIATAQSFIDDEPPAPLGAPNAFRINDFEPRAVAYYTIDEALQALPFNLSGQILYYDKAAFSEAGLDPERPPATFAEVTEYSQRLLKHNEQGEITRNGHRAHDQPVDVRADAGQGRCPLREQRQRPRSAERRRRSSTRPKGTTVLQWWRDIIDSGLATDATGATGGPLLALATGKSAMAIGSTAAIKDALEAIASDQPGARRTLRHRLAARACGGGRRRRAGRGSSMDYLRAAGGRAGRSVGVPQVRDTIRTCKPSSTSIPATSQSAYHRGTWSQRARCTSDFRSTRSRATSSCARRSTRRRTAP